MARVGFETTTQVFKRGKNIHALDIVATVIGFRKTNSYKTEDLQFKINRKFSKLMILQASAKKTIQRFRFNSNFRQQIFVP
jgi:hypothetical protein